MNPPDEFSRWIDQARRQVEQATPCGSGPSGPTGAPQRQAELLSFLPGYELVRELARGGQGVVYLARQQGTKRLVAVKMVREGPFSSTSERIRFEREIEILGRLNHPHIVTIHESGEASACSYFVMDYVAGPTLDGFVGPRREACRAGGAQQYATFVRQTLALFVNVCEAVHAAHLRGVIHRDLKPSNIRLNEQEQPLVLDFGLAKSTASADEPSGPPTLTETGQFVGTVDYASPEQVERENTPLDLRTDVYALGVILYELLSGRWPYGPAETASIRRKFDAILEQEPRPPRTWQPPLEDEVETILLKCLSKQPHRRYQSAGEVAQDIQHYLAGEPIEAKRDSALYVLRKNMRRHRAALGAAGLFIAMLVIATATLTIMYGRERRARERATRHYRQVHTLAQKLIFEMDEHVRPLAGSTAARSLLVNTGLEYLDRLAAETEQQDLDTLWDLASAYMKTGDIQSGLSANNLGDTAGAHESYDKALRIARSLHERNPTDPKGLDRLANALVRTGDVLIKMGHLEDGLASYRQALAVAEQLPVDVVAYRRLPGITVTKIGNALVKQGQLDDGLDHYRRALDISRALANDEPDDYVARTDVAVHEYKVGRVLAIQGQTDDALQRYRTALDLRRELAEEHPDSAEQRSACAELLVDIADALLRRDHLHEALAHYREALAADLELAAADPDNVRIPLELALIHERIAGVLAKQEDFDKATAHYEQSLDLREAVVAADPRDAVARRELAVAHEKLGNMLLEFERLDEALARYEASLAIREALLDFSPTSSEARRDIAVSHFKIAAVHAGAGANDALSVARRLRHWRDAQQRYARSLDIVQDMQSAGTLAPTDAGIPGLLEERIAECKERIQALGDPTP